MDKNTEEFYDRLKAELDSSTTWPAEYLFKFIVPTDETKIEAAITSKTSAILVTHVFGNPCNVDAIEAIAKKHHLKVIYDAAQCFGVEYIERTIFYYGDVSTCSFHATKLFHTGEGGAMFCNDAAIFHQLYSLLDL